MKCKKCHNGGDGGYISEYGLCNMCTLRCRHDMMDDYGNGNEMALPYGKTCIKCGHFDRD